MLYTIGDMAKKLGVQPSALRYYDKEGLLPFVNRSSAGIRMFSDDDLEWFRFIERLKRSGMPIKEIRRFIELYEQGDSTLEERRELIYARRAVIEQKIAELQEARDFLVYKCWFYDKAVEAGTASVPHEMPIDQLPPEIREIKERCDISKY